MVESNNNKRFVCIHGHFYQPAQENPWTGHIDPQSSAQPYHNWNEKMAAECYVKNAENYASMSFDFGPTLLSWIEEKTPNLYKVILEADQESQKRFSGHGSAIAQCYNHTIMPFSNHRDKYTQIYWGKKDFEHRFGRSPEGMWLPEMAVDVESLDLMAQMGITFTILAPHQGQRCRPIGVRPVGKKRLDWIDSRRPYKVHLPSGKIIVVFFHNNLISHSISHGDLLNNNEQLQNRILAGFSDSSPSAELVHFATEGEVYGGSHQSGSAALHSLLKSLDGHSSVHLTNYGEFLEKFPPTDEVEIVENTSWSCAHGIERWESDCGCHQGGDINWKQNWRAPLREALDWLHNEIKPKFGIMVKAIFDNAWKARNDYIIVRLNRDPNSADQFLMVNTTGFLSHHDKEVALDLLELQRHSMLMYTSAGWTYDELSGYETIQNMRHAARVIELVKKLFRKDLEPTFCEKLQLAKSNVPECRDGRLIYEKMAKMI